MAVDMLKNKPKAVYILGGGAVGVGFARAMNSHGVNVIGLWNRGQARVEELGDDFGCPVVTGELPRQIERADLVLLCVSDSGLSEVGALLAASGWVRPGTVVAHTSGCLPSTDLGKIEGAHLGSIHPLVTMPDAVAAAARLPGATLAIEGDAVAMGVLKGVVELLEGRAIEVSSVGKPRYHAAAVLASNLVVALLADAVREAEAAGVHDANRLLTGLAIVAAENVAERGALAALTGPIARGDVATVKRHLEALSEETQEVYRVMSGRALGLARARGLADEAYVALAKLLLAGA